MPRLPGTGVRSLPRRGGGARRGLPGHGERRRARSPAAAVAAFSHALPGDVAVEIAVAVPGPRAAVPASRCLPEAPGAAAAVVPPEAHAGGVVGRVARVFARCVPGRAAAGAAEDTRASEEKPRGGGGGPWPGLPRLPRRAGGGRLPKTPRRCRSSPAPVAAPLDPVRSCAADSSRVPAGEALVSLTLPG